MSEWLFKIGSGIALILSVFFIGSLLQTSDKSAIASPIDQTRNLKQNSDSKKQISRELQIASETNNQVPDEILSATPTVQIQTNKQTVELRQSSTQRASNNQPEARQKLLEESVYYCGAETKKGTPCTRRMKGGGRCWQHKGKDAMLPKDQLLVSK